MPMPFPASIRARQIVGASCHLQKISTPSSAVYPVRATVHGTPDITVSAKRNDGKLARAAPCGPGAASTSNARGPCRAISAVASLWSSKLQWSFAARAKCVKIARDQVLDKLMKDHKLDAFVAPTGGPPWLIDPILGDTTVGPPTTTMPAVAGYPHVTVPMGWTFGLPLGIYTLSAFFREIPWELEKAAKVDGATPFQAFVRVIAPLAAPGMVTTAILVFLACWNDFLLAISFTSTISSRTAPAAMEYFSGSSQFTVPTGPIAAAACVITVPIIVFVLFFQRRIVAGLTSGAVKG